MENLIQQLKDNEKPFGLMSTEMQEKAKAIGFPGNFRTYIWPNFGGIITNLEYGYSGHLTYRLRSDYEEASEAKTNDCIIPQTWENPESDINAAVLQVQQACDVLIESVNVLFRRST